MVATSAFRHRGRLVAIGDRFTAIPVEAAAYSYQRLATYDTQRAAMTTAPVDPPKRRTYRRRDLIAETPE